MNINPLASQIARHAEAVVQPRARTIERCASCGFGWIEMYARGEEPLAGEHVQMTLDDGTVVRITVEINPPRKT